MLRVFLSPRVNISRVINIEQPNGTESIEKTPPQTNHEIHNLTLVKLAFLSDLAESINALFVFHGPVLLSE